LELSVIKHGFYRVRRKIYMPEFLKSLSSRKKVFSLVSSSLSFPWDMPSTMVPLEQSFGKRASKDLLSPMDYPPFSRSLRDGYAIVSSDIQGVTASSPAFLRVTGEVPMGKSSPQKGVPGTAARVYTGGEIPPGFDSVVMEENVQLLGDLIELRSSAPFGNHVVSRGEEISRGVPILSRGERVDFTNLGLVASAGVTHIPLAEIRVGIISTGDEIRSVETRELPQGCVRDANGWVLWSMLEEWGCSCSYYGIFPDDFSRLYQGFSSALEENDIVFISGGSSVSTRDFCAKLFRETLSSPGLLVHGINIKPGKPTLIGGNRAAKKLAFGLPGHPFSCMVVMLGVVFPLLNSLLGFPRIYSPVVQGILAQDLLGKTGVEEFVPCSFTASGEVLPNPSRSGYISALRGKTGLVVLQEHQETLRKGEVVEVMLW